MLDYLKAAAIPAMNRIGIAPVGVFKMVEGDGLDLYVLLVHKSLKSVRTCWMRRSPTQPMSVSRVHSCWPSRRYPGWRGRRRPSHGFSSCAYMRAITRWRARRRSRCSIPAAK
ncbi:MAG: hypothetical protein ACYSR6_08115 [Planctomycetota bacterium]